MNNIDKILKNAVEGFEAPYDAAMWDKISSNLSPMEDAFRNSVDKFEAPYNPSAWSSIKNKIGNTTTLLQWIAGSAAAIGLVTGAVLFIPSNNDSAVIENVSRTDVSKTAHENFTSEKNTSSKLNLAVVSEESVTTEVVLTNDNTQILNENTNIVENTTSTPLDQQIASSENNENTIPVDQESLNTEAISVDNGTDNPDSDAVSTELIALKYNADFSVSALEVCAGEEILFNPTVLQRSVIYVWNFGDGTFSSEATTAHIFERGGNFDVSLTIRDARTNKILANSSQTVVINKLPSVNFSWEKSNEIIPTINFINLSSESSDWGWKVNGRMISDQNQFEYTFRDKGNYTVELNARNEEGCENTSQEVITIKNDYNLLAPTAFTPNGDNVNDDFIPQALRLTDNEFTMVIYNEQGETVYQTNSANLPWDGQNINDNSNAANGAYIWMVTLKNGNGIIENYKGQVFLTR